MDGIAKGFALVSIVYFIAYGFPIGLLLIGLVLYVQCGLMGKRLHPSIVLLWPAACVSDRVNDWMSR